MSELGVRLLGTTEVDRDGMSIGIRGDIPRALLARLSWTPGEILTGDQLVADVWAQAPNSAVSTLRAHLSRLRAAALGQALVGTRSGYALEVPRDHVDVTRVLDRIHRLGDPRPDETHLALLGELAMQLGDEFAAGLRHSPFLDRVRERLASERRRVEGDLAETALALGDEPLATAVLEGTVERNPRWERSTGLLATALARQTRFADAIEVLDARRRAVGSDAPPSAQLEALRASIVRLEPAVVAPLMSSGSAVSRVGVQIPLTRFIGRTEELDQLRAARRSQRLITIVGPAGVGKTRIAIELAREATTQQDDEQYMVDLAEVRDPAAVVHTIATSVRATDSSIAAVARRLSGRRVFVILDNADHVLGALSTAVSELLGAAPDVRLLVTSREPLRLSTEHEIVLRGFDGAGDGDAWRLLVERAADVRGGDPFDDTEEEAARRLCRELEGLPLALELAAARLDVLDAEEVRSGLGVHSARGRHGSVHAAIAWSFELLAPRLQRMLMHAARFAGPFTREAFAGVVGIEVAEADAVLRELVGKSLLAPERSGTARSRLRLLESTREFVAALDDGDDAAEWAARHRRWFARTIWTLGPTLRQFEARDTMAMLDGLRADIDAAMDSASVAADRSSALLLVAGLSPYWHLRGRFAEGKARLDTALALPAQVGDGEAAAVALALPMAELELANIAYQLGDAPAAFAAISAAQQHGSEVGDPSTTAVALSRAAYGHALFGDVELSETLIAEAERLSEHAAQWARCEVLLGRGQMLRGAGRIGEAIAVLAEGDAVASRIGYTWLITSTRYVLAKTLVDAKRAREAIWIGRETAQWAMAQEDAADKLALLHIIGGACAFTERHAIGAQLFGVVDALGIRYGYNPVAVEGPEAERLRAAVAAGISAEEFDRHYLAGRETSWDAAMLLVDALPRAEPRNLRTPGATGSEPSTPR